MLAWPLHLEVAHTLFVNHWGKPDVPPQKPRASLAAAIMRDRRSSAIGEAPDSAWQLGGAGATPSTQSATESCSRCHPFLRRGEDGYMAPAHCGCHTRQPTSIPGNPELLSNES